MAVVADIDVVVGAVDVYVFVDAVVVDFVAADAVL